KKKRKLPPVNGTATPSEVFHRNLVDAVSNVEDSDEHEQYVYPYSHHDKPGTPLTNNTTSNNNIINNKKQLKKRNQDLPTPYRRSTTPSRSSSTAASTFSLQQATNNTGPPPTSDEENGTWIKRGYRRPKLRSHVMDHPRSSAAFPQPWSHEASSSDDNDDDDDQHDLHHYQDDRYGEHIYLLRHHPGQQRKYRHTRSSCRIVRNTFLSILLFVLLMLIFTVYKAEPLTDVSASMGHILASDKELIFDLMVKANNWNWWTVRIQQADLSVFAFSELVPFNDTFGVDPAEYLGDCLYFDEPLSFTSSVILGRDERASTSTQIRIKSPGADASGNQRWSRMIRYPYGLVTRGVIKYRPFSLLNLSSSQSIPLCVVTHVDPITSITTVYFDDDHGYCSHYPILTY
ncbi:uncharacterized protein BX664DRAFT_253879, partial [Halteromyces radiatus]|uniref:uncharacterized protein n=1 Tax=Halteromyces radiatus TaxID=101107 RepID=UPI00221ECF82